MSKIKNMIQGAEDLAYMLLSEGEGSIVAEDNVFDFIWAHAGMEEDAKESSRDMAKTIVTEVDERYRSARG